MNDNENRKRDMFLRTYEFYAPRWRRGPAPVIRNERRVGARKVDAAGNLRLPPATIHHHQQEAHH